MGLHIRRTTLQQIQDMIMPLPLTPTQIENLTNENYTIEADFNSALEFFPELDGSASGGTPTIPSSLDGERLSYIRFMHANPFIGPVDVYVNGRKVAANLAYQDFTEYMPVFPGFYRIVVFPTGQTERPYSVTRTNIISGRIYTAALIGTATDISWQFIVDTKRELNTDRAYIRFIHLSPNAPILDVYINDMPVITDLAYREVSRYLAVLPGEHRMNFFSSITGEQVLVDPSMVLRGGRAYAVYIVGNAQGAPGLQVLIPLEGTTYLPMPTA